MEYAQNYPCIYGAIGYGLNTIKLGTSFHIANRKSGYKTQWRYLPQFKFVIALRKDSITPQELYKLDAKFLTYLHSRDYGDYHYNDGGGTELYNILCPVPYLDLWKDFLQKEGLPIEAIILDDPFPIRELTPTENEELLSEKRSKIKIIANINLRDNFFQTLLRGKVPRRIQYELWDKFETICNDDVLLAEIYKGIVQWPTGSGKTIAMLLIIVLIKERCIRVGTIYKGLLLSRTNDIFNTIKENFKNLSVFGIRVCDGTNAKLSKLDFPDKEHILIIATHSALIQDSVIEKLPENITHFHYDEVHRIGGEVLYTLLSKQLEIWGTKFLTGTSATPFTSSAKQRDKITNLFGNPINMIHQCGVEEAVNEGWIAKPRFITFVTTKIDDIAATIEAYVDAVIQTILKKMKADGFIGGKCITYLEGSIPNTEYAYNYSKNTYKNFRSYCATDNIRTDDKFCEEEYNKIPMILFACERYLEGSNILGLEMTARLVGESISAHSIVQVSGRALRLDYPNKEGWCMIFRPSKEGITPDDVLDSIVLDIIDLMGKSAKLYKKKDIVELIKTYMGSLSIDGNEISLDESVERIHAAYVRREYPKKDSKEKYTLIRDMNKELNLKSKDEYLQRANEHSKFIPDPKSYFNGIWNCWYDFLGVDCSIFPQTKADWVCVCKERGFWKKSWLDVKEEYYRYDDLPKNMNELYANFTNWDNEMEVEDED